MGCTLKLLAPLQVVSATRKLGIEIREILAAQAVEQLVYLLEQADAKLGYRFEWDPFGPHSRELAADITDLTPDDLDADEALDQAVRAATEEVSPLIRTPPGWRQRQPDWIRLLAMVDYLQREAGLELSNGDRPTFMTRRFNESEISAAKERVAQLPA